MGLQNIRDERHVSWLSGASEAVGDWGAVEGAVWAPTWERSWAWQPQNRNQLSFAARAQPSSLFRRTPAAAVAASAGPGPDSRTSSQPQSSERQRASRTALTAAAFQRLRSDPDPGSLHKKPCDYVLIDL